MKEAYCQTPSFPHSSTHSDNRALKVAYGSKVFEQSLKKPSPLPTSFYKAKRERFVEALSKNFLRLQEENENLKQALTLEREKLAIFSRMRAKFPASDNLILNQNPSLSEYSSVCSSFTMENVSSLNKPLFNVVKTISFLLETLRINSCQVNAFPVQSDELLGNLCVIARDLQNQELIASSYSDLRKKIMYFYNLYRKTSTESRIFNKRIWEERCRLEGLVAHLSKGVFDNVLKRKHHFSESKILASSSKSQLFFQEDELASLTFFLEDQKRSVYSLSKNESFVQELQDFMHEEPVDHRVNEEPRSSLMELDEVLYIQNTLTSDMAAAQDSIRKTKSFVSVYGNIE